MTNTRPRTPLAEVRRVMHRLAGPEVTELLAKVEELADKFCGP